jgi:hypothetical protein
MAHIEPVMMNNLSLLFLIICTFGVQNKEKIGLHHDLALNYVDNLNKLR